MSLFQKMECLDCPADDIRSELADVTAERDALTAKVEEQARELVAVKAQALAHTNAALSELFQTRNARAEAAESECARLREEVARIKAMDTPWPLADVLDVLTGTTEHLLVHHSCDCHGHERRLYAAHAADSIRASLLTPPSPTASATMVSFAHEAIEEPCRECGSIQHSQGDVLRCLNCAIDETDVG